jgi:hypothetical protein
MQIDLSDQTMRDVEAMLARTGGKANLTEYVDRTLKRAVFFDTVREVKRQNAGIDPQELEDLIDDAVDAVRSDRK